MNFGKRKILYVFYTGAFLMLIILLRLLYDNSSYDIDWLKINSVVGWLTLVWSIISWKNIRNEVISLYTSFLVLLYLFTFGQSLLIIFDLVHESRDLLFRFTKAELIDAQFFTLLSLVSFHLGALIICKKPSQHLYPSLRGLSEKEIEAANKRNINMINAIKYTGYILLAFSLPGFIYETISTLKAVIEGGYGALYGYHTGGLPSNGLMVRIFGETANYFIPSLICLLIVYGSTNKIRRLIYFTLAIYILNGLYIGGRGDSVILILALILVHHYSVKPLSKGNIVNLGVFSYFLISFLSIVASLRGLANKSIFDYFVAFKDSFGKENLFFQTISEIGWTMFPLGAVMGIIPSQYEFLYGKSYIYSLTSIFPNLGFWEIHPAKVYAGGAQWLMDTLNLWSGPAFTLVADAYRNFGWYGFIVLIAFGFLFGKIFSSVDKVSIFSKPEVLCVVMIFFEATLMSVRGDNLYIVRPFFFVVLPIYLLIKIIYGSLSRKSKLMNINKYKC